MLKRSFEKCMWEELSDVFGLEKLAALSALTTLLAAKVEISHNIAQNLIKLNQLIIQNFWNWNEDELKMQFISPLLYLVDYNDHPKYHPFSQRPMRMKTKEAELYGIVEWVLASGKQTPREPFFFLHEYKKEQGTDNDPLGQLLAAMLTAQHYNQDANRVLYGCYIVGKDWYFIALHGKQYATTLAYNVTELDKLQQVFSQLTYLKQLILA
jgi:hypothetical protein